MINFRFHIASLVAVFLALALGVVMGSTVVDRAIVESLRTQIDDVRGERLRVTPHLYNDEADIEPADTAANAVTDGNTMLEPSSTDRSVGNRAGTGATQARKTMRRTMPQK